MVGWKATKAPDSKYSAVRSDSLAFVRSRFNGEVGSPSRFIVAYQPSIRLRVESTYNWKGQGSGVRPGSCLATFCGIKVFPGPALLPLPLLSFRARGGFHCDSWRANARAANLRNTGSYGPAFAVKFYRSIKHRTRPKGTVARQSIWTHITEKFCVHIVCVIWKIVKYHRHCNE